MTFQPKDGTGFQAIGLHNIAKWPQWGRIAPDVREAVEVVGRVLPFCTNRYVLDELIDWSRVPDDPILCSRSEGCFKILSTARCIHCSGRANGPRR